MTFKELRKNKSLTVKEAAALIGVKEDTLYKYESTRRLPKWNTLKRMKDVYEVNLITIVNVYDLHKSKYEQMVSDKKDNF